MRRVREGGVGFGGGGEGFGGVEKQVPEWGPGRDSEWAVRDFGFVSLGLGS